MKFIIKKLALYLRGFSSLFQRFYNRLYSLFYAVQLGSCGDKFRIRTTSIIYSPENISIGNNFSSMGYLYLYANEGKIVMGNNISINTNVQIGASGGKIFMGNNILIAPNVVIRAADHGLKAGELIMSQPHTPGTIYIEDDVWIGSNAVITANLTLSKGTVVAGGAVVTRSTEPYSIVGGVPARKISERL
ncbi:MAG: acyltransferase [Deltaproteobacteria bacterium]|nr:MAG: acyltransferase [Deltaproteobacteria bacterium]